ncbi:hypothetical protein FHX78_131 [Streptomyces capillispiralis]|uniref:Uncharacterized protein n=2 Tax=Streptomyces capillispiralis TaxID=68182 RepID=A0A561SG85_9ACTN|nr:hypothetical protein FHX78_131 [Streptomyces capillispiralis]
MTGDPDTVVAVWVTPTWCGTRYETLTADGQVTQLVEGLSRAGQ